MRPDDIVRSAPRRRPGRLGHGAAGVLIVSMVAVLVFGLDVATKSWVQRALALHEPVPVLGEFVRLALGYNTGVAFGLIRDAGAWLFAGSSAIVVALVVWGARTARTVRAPIELWPAGLVRGGAVANVVDRLPDGRVTDFLDVGLGAARWPAFNLADSAIVVGLALLLLANSISRLAEEAP